MRRASLFADYRSRWRCCDQPHRMSPSTRSTDHAGGVYFRNRSHRARVAIKQFRYALELGDSLGVAAIADVRPLRKAQNALGAAHDRDVLLRQITELSDDDSVMAKRSTSEWIELTPLSTANA